MIAWAIETFAAATLLMLLVLAIRGPVRRAFGPNMAYALWLLPVLRMALPPLPQGWREQAVTPVAAAGEAITTYVIAPLSTPAAQAAFSMTAAPAAPAAAPIDWLLVIGGVWAAGVLGFLGWHLIAHTRFCNRLLRRARVDRMVAQGRVRVIETDAAHGPLAFGIWRKYVAFPRDFSERYDAVERDLALAHELGHHIRGDLIANWVALIMLALHWFNPVAWRAFRAFRADQEMACDALVLAGRDQALRHAYGRAIVKSAHGGAVSAACHLHTINDLKGRLRMLSRTTSISPRRLAAGIAGVSTLAVAALAVTASGTQAAERIKDKVSTSIGVDLGALDAHAAKLLPATLTLGTQAMPEAPAAPAAPPAPEAAVAPEAPSAPAAPVGAVPPVPAAPRAPGAVQAPAAPQPPAVPQHSMAWDSVGPDGKHEHHRIVIRDRESMVDEEAIAASLPEIRDAKCGKGGPPTVVETLSGGKKRITLCTDRIEVQAREAGDKARMIAINARRIGMDSAMMGLRAARTAIEAQTDLSAEQRSQALAGIDSAIAGIEAGKAGQHDDN